MFPAGLLTRAQEALRGVDGTFKVAVNRLPRLETNLPPSAALPDGTTLYPEQQKAVAAAVERQRGLWALAVNAGKTECAAWLLHAYKDRRALYIVNSRALLNQTVKRLETRLGRAVGVLGSGQRLRLERRVVVAMIQTLHARRGKPEVTQLLDSTELLICDEVDSVTPHSYFPILGACPAPFRIGMSGTVREHQAPILAEAFFGPAIAEIDNRELVALGRSAEPIILMPFSGALVPESRDYDEIYLPGIVRNAARNAQLAEAAAWGAARGLRTLILYFRLEHGELLARELASRGVRYALLHGGSPPSAIAEARQRLMDRSLNCVCASRIFNVGVDIPELEILINAGAWKSARATEQKKGRGMRRKLTGPNRVIIIDPYDLGCSLLKRHSEARKRLYERQGFPVQRGELPALLAGVTV